MGCGGSNSIGHKPQSISDRYPVQKLTLSLSLEVDSIEAYNDKNIVLGCIAEL